MRRGVGREVQKKGHWQSSAHCPKDASLSEAVSLCIAVRNVLAGQGRERRALNWSSEREACCLQGLSSGAQSGAAMADRNM